MVNIRQNCYGSDYEFSLYNGEQFVIFNIVEVNTDKKEITVAVSNEGKISICAFELLEGTQGLYFEYGHLCNQIAIEDFEIIQEEF